MIYNVPGSKTFRRSKVFINHEIEVAWRLLITLLLIIIVMAENRFSRAIIMSVSHPVVVMQ